MNERLRYRLGLRSSNAARPYRNRAREAKVNPPWWDDQLIDDIHDYVYEDDVDGD